MSGPAGWPQLAQTLAGLEAALAPPKAAYSKRSPSPYLTPNHALLPSFLRPNHALLPSTHSKRAVVPMSQYSYAVEAITCSDAADNKGVTTKTVFKAIEEASVKTSKIFGTIWDPGYWCHK